MAASESERERSVGRVWAIVWCAVKKVRLRQSSRQLILHLSCPRNLPNDVTRSVIPYPNSARAPDNLAHSPRSPGRPSAACRPVPRADYLAIKREALSCEIHVAIWDHPDSRSYGEFAYMEILSSFGKLWRHSDGCRTSWDIQRSKDIRLYAVDIGKGRNTHRKGRGEETAIEDEDEPTTAAIEVKDEDEPTMPRQRRGWTRTSRMDVCWRCRWLMNDELMIVRLFRFRVQFGIF